MSIERKTVYIALPERDDLVFEENPDAPFFATTTQVPQDIVNYIVRLIKPSLNAFEQEGWLLDDDRLYALEPDVKSITKWFGKVKFRCKGVTVHLIRARTS